MPVHIKGMEKGDLILLGVQADEAFAHACNAYSDITEQARP